MRGPYTHTCLHRRSRPRPTCAERVAMLQSGILLAIGSAVFCGWADICASQGAKRLGTAKATFLALSMGTLALALFGVLAFARLGLTPQSLVWSIPPGICVGALT